MDSDRVVRTDLYPSNVTSAYTSLGQMVLAAGHLTEFDSPAALLMQGGLFKGMGDESIDREKLRKMVGL